MVRDEVEVEVEELESGVEKYQRSCKGRNMGTIGNFPSRRILAAYRRISLENDYLFAGPRGFVCP